MYRCKVSLLHMRLDGTIRRLIYGGCFDHEHHPKNKPCCPDFPLFSWKLTVSSTRHLIWRLSASFFNCRSSHKTAQSASVAVLYIRIVRYFSLVSDISSKQLHSSTLCTHCTGKLRPLEKVHQLCYLWLVPPTCISRSFGLIVCGPYGGSTMQASERLYARFSQNKAICKVSVQELALRQWRAARGRCYLTLTLVAVQSRIPNRVCSRPVTRGTSGSHGWHAALSRSASRYDYVAFGIVRMGAGSKARVRAFARMRVVGIFPLPSVNMRCPRADERAGIHFLT